MPPLGGSLALPFRIDAAARREPRPPISDSLSGGFLHRRIARGEMSPLAARADQRVDPAFGLGRAEGAVIAKAHFGLQSVDQRARPLPHWDAGCGRNATGGVPYRVFADELGLADAGERSE